MNWTNFQTYGMAPDKAFEVLCNQLFENWSKEEYKSDIASIRVVNGAGGDGGVESYAVLKDGSIIGLQAKWFPTSMASSQIAQIKNSIKTAKKVRPEISRYIVCVPRDLASKTARSENSEDTRWENMITSVVADYPDLAVELWNESRIVAELQKPSASGIFKFWFENAEVSDESVQYAFEKAKSSWLTTKYVPELNTYGNIAQTLSLLLGDIVQRENQTKTFRKINELCERFHSAAEAFLVVCGDRPEITDILTETMGKVSAVASECLKITAWYRDETPLDGDIDLSAFNVDFDSAADSINQSRDSTLHYFHASDVTKVLRKLGEFDFYALIKDFERSHHKKSLLFFGTPGTGKTHGISALSEKLLSDGLHIPLLIQARNIPIYSTWKNIVCDYLGLSSSWNEDEIWQALISLADRHRFQEPQLSAETKVSPKVIIFVDGLDESSTHERWVERIQETNAITASYPQIRFCFTARPTAFKGRIDYAKVERLSNVGDAPTHILFDSYMRAYNIKTQNNGWLKYSLTSPLALKLFCELNQDQTVSLSNRTEVSMTSLWRKKIEKIEGEYCEKNGRPEKNQYVLRAVVFLSKQFVAAERLEHSSLVDKLAAELKTATEYAESLVNYLEEYGVLSCYCEHGIGLAPDTYFYYPGIQGYFDYASALHILSQYEHPKDIDFNDCKAIQTNTLNSLAIISIQKYGYLLTRNPTIDVVMDDWSRQELQFLTLLHSDHSAAAQFKERTLEIMSENADGLITIVNQLVLPLSRDCEHPLGVMLLDEFLNGFEKPAQRDILWSVPGYLRNSTGKRWYQSETFALEGDNYLLDPEDTHEGCPTVYAWALSTVNNSLRKLYRNRLMEWAHLVPEEFYKLFLKFSAVNDPQIKSDLFSILMCLIYDGADQALIKNASDWILENILHPDRIDGNRDISVRYYSIAIIKRAIIMGILDEQTVVEYMPPYTITGNSIALNKDALSGTRMNGYSAIDYDLSRYVLVDHIESDFNSYPQRNTKQFEKLVSAVITEQPEYAGMTVEKFIISAAFAYILEMGWNEQEFYNFNEDESGEGIVGGVDCSIRGTHHSATHGSQSSVMTVCEKYVWQARNEISGFLCDRLLFGDENVPVTDYGLLDDFVIPVQEARIINPDNIPDDRPWHIPEPEKAVLEGIPSSAKDVITYVLEAPTLDWEKWIFFKNIDGAYRVEAEDLVALDMYSCFYGSAGVETCLFMNAILVNQDDVLGFAEAITEKSNADNRVANPTDWYGGIHSSCYITPKEVCWFSWKARYDSANIEVFPQFELKSAVDDCCYNSPEYGDVYFYLPSAPIRDIIGIVDSDGYLFFDNSRKVIAEHSIAGEKWRTYQNYVIVDRPVLFERLQRAGKRLVWIMRERRIRTGNAQEKFGEFGADRDKSYIGYFDGNKFTVREIHSEIWNSEPKKKSL